MPDKKYMFICSPAARAGRRWTGCGRGLVPRPTNDPQSDVERRAKEERSKSEYEDWMEKSMDFQRSFIRAKNEQDNNQGD